jgi:hypothetical protein
MPASSGAAVTATKTKPEHATDFKQPPCYCFPFNSVDPYCSVQNCYLNTTQTICDLPNWESSTLRAQHEFLTVGFSLQNSTGAKSPRILRNVMKQTIFHPEHSIVIVHNHLPPFDFFFSFLNTKIVLQYSFSTVSICLTTIVPNQPVRLPKCLLIYIKPMTKDGYTNNIHSWQYNEAEHIQAYINKHILFPFPALKRTPTT